VNDDLIGKGFLAIKDLIGKGNKNVDDLFTVSLKKSNKETGKCRLRVRFIPE